MLTHCACLQPIPEGVTTPISLQIIPADTELMMTGQIKLSALGFDVSTTIASTGKKGSVTVWVGSSWDQWPPQVGIITPRMGSNMMCWRSHNILVCGSCICMGQSLRSYPQVFGGDISNIRLDGATSACAQIGELFGHRSQTDVAHHRSFAHVETLVVLCSVGCSDGVQNGLETGVDTGAFCDYYDPDLTQWLSVPNGTCDLSSECTFLQADVQIYNSASPITVVETFAADFEQFPRDDMIFVAHVSGPLNLQYSLTWELTEDQTGSFSTSWNFPTVAGDYTVSVDAPFAPQKYHAVAGLATSFSVLPGTFYQENVATQLKLISAENGAIFDDNPPTIAYISDATEVVVRMQQADSYGNLLTVAGSTSLLLVNATACADSVGCPTTTGSLQPTGGAQFEFVVDLTTSEIEPSFANTGSFSVWYAPEEAPDLFAVMVPVQVRIFPPDTQN